LRISIIGVGYVGLTTAVGFAMKGHGVVCIDTDDAKVNLIRRGKSPIWEQGLEEQLSRFVGRRDSLEATSDYGRLLDTDVTLICVGTPSNPDGSIDLSSIEESARQVGTTLRDKTDYHVVVTRSTVIPGTTRDVIIPLLEEHSGKKAGDTVGVAVNPEFMQEGKALQAFLTPDRVIVGEYDQRAGDMLVELSREFDAPVVRTDVVTAEIIKYASNAFLATKISFINEIGNICQRLGIDVYDVAKGISYDYRIGDRFLNAGIGFGGSCLPKDLRALVNESERQGYQPQLLQSVLAINDRQAARIVQVAEEKLGGLTGRKVAVLGLAFKPNTDDMRGAPSTAVVQTLLEKGAVVSAHDPRAMSNARPLLPSHIRYAASAQEAIRGSDCVMILTEWDEYRDENLYRGMTVIDGRRALDPGKAAAVCDYQGVCW